MVVQLREDLEASCLVRQAVWLLCDRCRRFTLGVIASLGKIWAWVPSVVMVQVFRTIELVLSRYLINAAHLVLIVCEL